MSQATTSIAAWRVQRQPLVGGGGSRRDLAGFEYGVSLLATEPQPFDA